MKRDMTSIFRGLASCAVFRGVLQTELFERFGTTYTAKNAVKSSVSMRMQSLFPFFIRAAGT